MKSLILALTILIMALSVSGADRDGVAVDSSFHMDSNDTIYIEVSQAVKCNWSWFGLWAEDTASSATDSVDLVAKWCQRNDALTTIRVNNSDSINLTDSTAWRTWAGGYFQPPAAVADKLWIMIYPGAGIVTGNSILCSTFTQCRYE